MRWRAATRWASCTTIFTQVRGSVRAGRRLAAPHGALGGSSATARHPPPPGSGTKECSREQAIANVCAGINACHAAVPTCVLVIETMAAQGATVGSTLEEVAEMIAGVTDKARVGVCIDTAHIWSAGYDISSQRKWDEFLAKFDAVIGLSYLRGMHLNDSKGAGGGRKDGHEQIGGGHIGVEGG